MLYLTVDSDSSVIYLPDDRIFKGRKITRLYFFTSDDVSTDVTGNPVVPANFLNYLYLNLFSEANKKIYQNLSLSLLNINCNAGILVSDILDYVSSEIKILRNTILNPGVTYSLPVGFEYETGYRDPFSENADMFRLVFNLSENRSHYLLSSHGGTALSGTRIRRITAKGNLDGFLTLREVSGKVYNEIPLSLLRFGLNTEDLYFDNIRLDVWNSYIEIVNPSNNPLELLFYYE